METDLDIKPFYTVYFRCDDQFNPKVPSLIELTIQKLIKEKLPHMVVQNRSGPTVQELLEMNAYVYYVHMYEAEMVEVAYSKNWEDHESRIIICTEIYDSDTPLPKDADLYWKKLNEK